MGKIGFVSFGFVALAAAAVAFFGAGVIPFMGPAFERESCAASSAYSASANSTQVVKNELDNADGAVKFFSRFDRENFHDGYFNDLSISALSPGFKAYVMGHYHGLSRRQYDYAVCVYDPDGNIAGARGGYGAVFTPEDDNWWYALSFWAEDVLIRPGVWRAEVSLTDIETGRRLVLSRNLPVAD